MSADDFFMLRNEINDLRARVLELERAGYFEVPNTAHALSPHQQYEAWKRMPVFRAVYAIMDHLGLKLVHDPGTPARNILVPVDKP